jgi:predicted flap endonuclease-1-like 5' DNA nuclease
MHRIGEVEDIDDGMEAKLTGLGIRTTDDFLARAATPAGRAALASEVGSTAATVLTWANCADLMRVDGIGMQFADLLEAAGVDTIPELAQRNAPNLHERVAALNDEKKLAGRAPTGAEIEAWIVQAKALPRIIEYAGAAAPAAATPAAAPMPAPAPTAMPEPAPVVVAPEPAPLAVAPEPVPVAAVPEPAPVVERATGAAEQTLDTAASATQNARSEASAGGEHAVDAGREAAGDAASDTATRAHDTLSSVGASGAGWWQKLMARLRGR